MTKERFARTGARFAALAPYIILSWAWLVFFPVSRTLADGNCGLTQDKFDAIRSIQENYSLDYSARIKGELAIRKNLLSQTIDCAISEANAALANLNNVSANDGEIARAQSQAADQISQAIKYYQIQKARIDDLGIQGSKDFARDLASWRAGNYEPAAKNAYDLSIWARNQDIVRIANDRLDQIGQSVNLLKIVDNKEVQELWNKAEANFNDAIQWNEKAKENLVSFGSPDDSLNMIKSSLESLSSTYQNFFDIVSAISKALHP